MTAEATTTNVLAATVTAPCKTYNPLKLASFLTEQFGKGHYDVSVSGSGGYLAQRIG